ncbi:MULTISPECIES: GLPGLI family protein [Polaribacter]|uniref:GLPGLI family protein n=1 Tax=Polaribacter sejongensis TaxID=985043 RepID=A0AAJ1QYY7_9FLAO|nr:MULTISPECIES: GLPGLI family protein [Polaribacter]AUC21078.1 ribonuclease Z [Polaribacter sejongensis]MDN3620752.1 GLPGLI family protein [Polaribacter undariae]UWD31352.1 GLPGLI family protein [Polaribacter undariae]
MKSLFTFILALVSIITFGQKDFQGKAIYMSKTSIDLSNFARGGEQLSEARKKQLQARMKSQLEKTFILNFDKSSSLYKEDEKLEAPTTSGGGRGRGFGGFTSGGTKYKNTKDKVALEATEFFGKKFLVSDVMEQPQWELGGETKQIGSYLCYKATLLKDANPLDFSNFRRPGRGEEAEEKSEEEKEVKQILVTAWYTPQIPVSNGPGEYWGLPGLILEISEGTTTILCTEIVLNPSEKEAIEAPSKGKKITREKYTETVTKKMEELRQNFQNRGRGGNRGGGRN